MKGFPDLDESKAREYLGKTILVDVTNLDHKGNVERRRMWFGTIQTFSNREGIRVLLDDSEKLCWFPPSTESVGAIRKADPGMYELKPSGKVIENPDFLTILTYQEPSPKKKRNEG